MLCFSVHERVLYRRGEVIFMYEPSLHKAQTTT